MATPKFTYTGQYDLQIVDDIKGYIRLLTSGSLTFEQDIVVDAYLLGGGGDGGDGQTYNKSAQNESQYSGGGGGSGYATNVYNIFTNNGKNYDIVIGESGDKTTAFNSIANGGLSAVSVNGGAGGNGGSGGSGRILSSGYWIDISPGRAGSSQSGAPATTYAFNRDKPPFNTMSAPTGGKGTTPGSGNLNQPANSGSGGHGSYYGEGGWTGSGAGGNGGSGIVIVRWGFTQGAFLTNLTPTAGFVNEKIENKFLWSLTSIPIQLEQQFAIFQWRIRNSANINTINIGTTQYAIVPANTLPQGEFEWRVSATNTAGIVAPFTEWFLLTTIDPKPNKPTGLYPNTGTRDGTKPISFSWIHNSPLSTSQAAFEVEVTYDNGTIWQNLSNKIITVNTQFNAAANTVLPTDPTGRIGWRVRTYNTDNVASDWSDTAFFIVHPAPQAPNWISVEAGQPRPLSRWTSLMQVGFQVQVLLGEAVFFDSGEIHGTQTEYRIPEFLNNGVYTFRVRIKNVRGLYSDWANRAVSINAQSRLNIILQGEAVEGGAQLNFNVEVRAIGQTAESSNTHIIRKKFRSNLMGQGF